MSKRFVIEVDDTEDLGLFYHLQKQANRHRRSSRKETGDVTITEADDEMVGQLLEYLIWSRHPHRPDV